MKAIITSIFIFLLTILLAKITGFTKEKFIAPMSWNEIYDLLPLIIIVSSIAGIIVFFSEKK